MALDRIATLRDAEKHLREGMLEAAIAEYVRVVEDQPRDWNTANLLGDLYVRIGQVDKAVEQFMRIADSLAEDGFLPRASALYKKILKLRPEHDHALLQAAELAASQGLLADARAYLGSIVERARGRGDGPRVAQARIRLGAIDPADLDARLAAASARVELNDVAGAVRDLKDIASALTEKGRAADAIEILRKAALLDPADVESRLRLADAFMARDDVASAVASLTVDVAVSDSRLLLAAVEMLLRANQTAPALSSARTLLEEHPDAWEPLARLGLTFAAETPDAAFGVLELAIDQAVAVEAWAAATATLQEFVERVPNHIGTLMRLVEVCIDGDLEAITYAAQAQLADAYLAAGMAAEAKPIAEDLLAREPWEWANCERFKRVLQLMGESDPDAVIAERLAGQSPFTSTDLFAPIAPTDSPAASAHEAVPPVSPQTAPAAARGAPPIEDQPEGLFNLSAETIDLEKLLGELEPQSTGSDSMSERIDIDLSLALDEPVQPDAADLPVDVDGAFSQLRAEAAERFRGDEAEVQYARAVELRQQGDIEGSIEALQAASRAPALRFAAASMLGRLYREGGKTSEAVEWFERAAQAPAPSPGAAFDLLYDLADALESEGEMARALAVCLELQADAGSYRDVNERIDRLTKVQARG